MLLGVGAFALVAGCAREKSTEDSAGSAAKPADEPSSVKAGDASGSAAKRADVSDPKPQETCPVMGGEINKDIFVDYQGKRVYFCCAGCESSFNKNPEKYIEKLKKKGEAPIDVPK